jgi:AraC family transcriptional regulator of arabinose operon
MIILKGIILEKPTTYNNIPGFRCLRNIPKQTDDLFLVHCGIQKCPPGYTYNHKIPNENHLHFVLDGKGILEINDKIYHIKKDDIFVIPKGHKIRYFADDDDPWEYMWLTFDGNKAETYLGHIGLSAECPVIHSELPVKIYYPIIGKILDTNELTFANEIRRVGYLYEVISSLIEAQSAYKRELNIYDYSSDTYVAYALQYIKLNYSKIKVNDIAQYIGISRSYLTAIFKKQLNISPQEYLVSFRLKRSAELLKTSNASIKEIADMIGYDNPLTFSKMFKQTYGISPREYRKQGLV